MKIENGFLKSKITAGSRQLKFEAHVKILIRTVKLRNVNNNMYIFYFNIKSFEARSVSSTSTFGRY